MEKNSGKGFGIASLIFGIVAIVFTEFIIISIICAALAIIFGLVGKNHGDNGFSKVGIILGIASLVLTFLLFLFLEVFDVSIFYIPSWYIK